jgi:hypothetical protein
MNDSIRPKDSGPHPCDVCGYAESAAVHQPRLNDPKGKPWGHEYKYHWLEQGDWTNWPGGECPVTPETRVEIRTRDGMESIGLASEFTWTHDRNNVNYGDIVEYRVEREDD